MSEKTSFARVAQAVLAVDELQAQMARVRLFVDDLAERVKALEAAAAPPPKAVASTHE